MAPPHAAFTSRIHDLRGHTVEVAQVRPHARLRGHAHDVPHVCIVTRGGFREGRQLLEPGTVRMSLAGDRHHLSFGSDGATCLLLHLGPELARAWPEARRIFQDAGVLNAARQAVEEADTEDETLGHFVLETLTAEILSACRCHTRRVVERYPPHWLSRVRERLHEEFATALDLEGLAIEAGVTREHAARVFRDHYGYPMGEYVRRRRVEFACERLRRSDQPLAEVALEAGFSDQSHMTRLFRQMLGRTPAALRRSQR